MMVHDWIAQYIPFVNVLYYNLIFRIMGHLIMIILVAMLFAIAMYNNTET